MSSFAQKFLRIFKYIIFMLKNIVYYFFIVAGTWFLWYSRWEAKCDRRHDFQSPPYIIGVVSCAERTMNSMSDQPSHHLPNQHMWPLVTKHAADSCFRLPTRTTSRVRRKSSRLCSTTILYLNIIRNFGAVELTAELSIYKYTCILKGYPEFWQRHRVGKFF